MVRLGANFNATGDCDCDCACPACCGTANTETLTATVTGVTNCSLVDGQTWDLDWLASTVDNCDDGETANEWWASDGVDDLSLDCGGSGPPILVGFEVRCCCDGTYSAQFRAVAGTPDDCSGGSGWVDATSVQCDPFQLEFEGLSIAGTGCNCCEEADVTVTL